MTTVITIDGPSGAGKGTIARLLAEAKGFHLLDSGSLYRLVALKAMQEGLDEEQVDLLADLAAGLDVTFSNRQNTIRIELDAVDVTEAIRRERVAMMASKLAALPPVRSALLQRQRDFAQAPGLVADGRDMGTVVFPQAKAKFFLTASAKERAQRRCLQLQRAGESNVDFDVVLRDIERRDQQDRSRATAPLIAADDAVEIDTSDLTIEGVFERIISHLKKVGL